MSIGRGRVQPVRGAVGAVFPQGAEHVAGGEQAGRLVELGGLQRLRVARAVAPLVDRSGEGGHRRQDGAAGQQPLRLVGVQADLLALGVVQRAGLVPDQVRARRPGRGRGASRRCAAASTARLVQPGDLRRRRRRGRRRRRSAWRSTPTSGRRRGRMPRRSAATRAGVTWQCGCGLGTRGTAPRPSRSPGRRASSGACWQNVETSARVEATARALPCRLDGCVDARSG